MMCKIFSVELNKLSTWLALNKLALNIYKADILFFLNRQSIGNNISMNGVNSLKVDSLRFLGVWIHYEITWKDYITYISHKLS